MRRLHPFSLVLPELAMTVVMLYGCLLMTSSAQAQGIGFLGGSGAMDLRASWTNAPLPGPLPLIDSDAGNIPPNLSISLDGEVPSGAMNATVSADYKTYFTNQLVGVYGVAGMAVSGTPYEEPSFGANRARLQISAEATWVYRDLSMVLGNIHVTSELSIVGQIAPGDTVQINFAHDLFGQSRGLIYRYRPGLVTFTNEGAFVYNISDTTFEFNPFGGDNYKQSVYLQIDIIKGGAGETWVNVPHFTTAVPEPSTFALAAISFVALCAWSRKRRK